MQDLLQELRSHVNMFYKELIALIEGALESWQLISKEKYTMILTALIRIHHGEPVKLLRSIYPQIYKWYKIYALIARGDSFVIMARPHDACSYPGVDKNVDVETVRRLTYFEAAYSEIKRLMAKSIQRDASYMFILTNMLRTLDTNHVGYSPTRAQFVVITRLLNIELLGLQDGYLGGETTDVNSEWEAARDESLVGGQGDGDVTCNY